MDDLIHNELLSNLDTAKILLLRQYLDSIVTEDNFIQAINCIFDEKRDRDAADLFRALANDREIHADYLFDRLVLYRRKSTQSDEPWTVIRRNDIRIEDLHHCKRESIAMIVPIEAKSSFCYAVISKHGRVGLYDGKFALLLDYDVFFNRTGIVQRIRDVWITSAIYLNDTEDLIMTASDKSMMVYDASTLCHTPTFLITGMLYTITSLSYDSSPDKIGSQLFMGDDHGGIAVLFFKQPSLSLFHKKIQDKLNTYFWIDLQGKPHDAFCRIKYRRSIHSQAIKKIVYVRNNHSIISSSKDPNRSIVIQYMKKTRDPYVFKIVCGVSCFFYSETLGILATGSPDGCIRLWEPVAPSKPSAICPSQNTCIIDVVILARLCLVVSLNKNGVLKIWNVLQAVCMQSVNVNFPSFGILGRPIQFGLRSIYYGPPKSQETIKNDEDKWNRCEIIVTCCNHIAIIPLDGVVDDFGERLPPPEKNLRPRKPSAWDDDQFHIDALTSMVVKRIERSQDSVKFDAKLSEMNNLLQNAGLTNIFDRKFISDSEQGHNMNVKLAILQSKTENMQAFPYTTLEIYDHGDIKFSQPLPLSRRMKRISGLEYVTDPLFLIKYESCFALPSPKIKYLPSDNKFKSEQSKSKYQ